jgi:prepilin-type N-terminal cleavage/methylation domain-containing protein
VTVAYRAQRHSSRARGFTLLELLVVMVLMGMMTGVVFVSLSRWFDSLVVRSEWSQVQGQLRKLPVWSALAQQRVELSAPAPAAAAQEGFTVMGAPPLWRLQSGWRVESGRWRMHSSGVCEAGVVVLHQIQRNRRFEAQLQAGSCRVEFAPVAQTGGGT